MIKLKNILGEAYAWERQEGKPLPTLKDVQEAYDSKGVEDAADEANEGAKPDYVDLDNDGDEKESMKDAAEDAQDDNETNEGDDMNHSYHTPEDDVVDLDILNMGSLEESFNKRMLGNLHGSEYILRETFRG